MQRTNNLTLKKAKKQIFTVLVIDRNKYNYLEESAMTHRF